MFVQRPWPAGAHNTLPMPPPCIIEYACANWKKEVHAHAFAFDVAEKNLGTNHSFPGVCLPNVPAPREKRAVSDATLEHVVVKRRVVEETIESRRIKSRRMAP